MIQFTFRAKVVAFLIMFMLSYGQLRAAPVIFYTDITSGPNSGGENNNGIYLSIYGKGFGTEKVDSKVYINNTEVAAYKYWGNSVGRSDIQQITIQPGSSVSTGAIKVTVGGEDSNVDHSFTVRSGDIYFVSLTGNDSTGTAGNITLPYRLLEYGVHDLAAFGAGDTAVLRGGEWSDSGTGGNFIRVDKTGTEANPISFMGYPGEDVYINRTGDSNPIFKLYKSTGGVNISNLRADTGGDSGAAIGGDYVRFVSNDFQGMHLSATGTGLISANVGSHIYVLGNSLYEYGDSKLYHGVYVSKGDDIQQDDIEIAYNHIYDADSGGRGVQIYTGSGSSTTFSNVKIHDNLIHNMGYHGISLGNNVGAGALVYNNVIYETLGIRISSTFAEAEIYNNTLYNNGNGIDFEDNAFVSAVIKNNIIYATGVQTYYQENADAYAADSTTVNNIWYGNGSAPSFDTGPINSDPLFTSIPGDDFSLQSDSPARNTGLTISEITMDIESVARPQGAQYDIGAYEYSDQVPQVPQLPQPEILSIQIN